ncbi:unnamed protein product [Schistosoma curassoni]|uniref:Homeobox domain-containing protein n=1 Tax=Schistosoma curassoni TaxID=6186 RepID=A0A183K6Z3_9TREM|nr:unnamed protein product [Schistosoma curassoni]
MDVFMISFEKNNTNTQIKITNNIFKKTYLWTEKERKNLQENLNLSYRSL